MPQRTATFAVIISGQTGLGGKIGNDFTSKNDESYNQSGRFTEADSI